MIVLITSCAAFSAGVYAGKKRASGEMWRDIVRDAYEDVSYLFRKTKRIVFKSDECKS